MDSYTFYDKALNGYHFEIKRSRGYYTVYLDGRFYCSADSVREAEDEIDEYARDNNLKTLFEVL